MKPTGRIIISLSTIFACLTLWAQESPRSAGSGLVDRFKQMDRNGDRKISAEEFPGALFQQVDKDGDGFVTVAEAREFYRSRAARQAAPAAPPASVVSPEQVNVPPDPAPATPPVSVSRAFADRENGVFHHHSETDAFTTEGDFKIGAPL